MNALNIMLFLEDTFETLVKHKETSKGIIELSTSALDYGIKFVEEKLKIRNNEYQEEINEIETGLTIFIIVYHQSLNCLR